MKRWFSIVFLVGMVAFSACNRLVETRRATSLPTDVSPELSAIDSLMWQRPDSALTCLLPYFDTCCRDGVHTVSTTHDCHYANLLLAELLYKNDNPQLNRTDLLQAVDYYDSLCCCRDAARHVSTDPTLVFLDARAHYINGVGYYERDSVVEACREYLKALDIIEDHFNEKDLVGHKAQFMALTYTRLTMLFSDLYLHEQAIYYAQHSLPYYYKKLDAPSWYLARMLSEIGTNYDMVKQWDSADYYYSNAILFISDTNSLIYRDIRAHQCYLEYEMGKQPEFSTTKLYNLLTSSNSQNEYFSRAATLAEIYYHEKQYDSALVYLKKVFEGSPRTDSKKQAAEWLVEICKVQGREADILDYANFLVPFANKEENQSAIKSQLTELYNAFRLRVSDRQHHHLVRKNAQWTTIAIGVLLIIVFTIICFYYQNKQRPELLENQKSEDSGNAQDRIVAFIDESVCQEIIQSVHGQNIKRLATPKAFPELVLTDAQLQQLNLLATKYFGPMDILLEKHSLKAKPSLVNLCNLYLLGMDEKQAAILLNRDYSSVKRYEKTLKTAFNTQENMVTFLRNLVLNQ